MKRSGQSGLHESLTREETIEGPSNLSFGRTFFFVFQVLALIFWWRVSLTVAIVLSVIGVVFGLAAYLAPAALGPINRVWMKFGLLLSRVVNPIVMGVLFYGVFTPMGLLMRMLGKRPLPLEFDPEAATYWIDRQPGPRPETMTRQF